MLFHYVLSLYFEKFKRIGSTNNLGRRIKEHNEGKSFSTKLRRPLKLIYLEGYACEEEARHREHNLKLRSRAFAQLMKRINNSINS